MSFHLNQGIGMNATTDGREGSTDQRQ